MVSVRESNRFAKLLSKKSLEKLITTGSLDIRDGFLSKSGKRFQAGLKLEYIYDEKGTCVDAELSFKFPPKAY